MQSYSESSRPRNPRVGRAGARDMSNEAWLAIAITQPSVA